MDGEIMEVVSSSKYSGSCFSKDRGPQENVKKRVGEGLKIFGAMKVILIVKTVSSGERKECYGRVVVPAVTYGAQIRV